MRSEPPPTGAPTARHGSEGIVCLQLGNGAPTVAEPHMRYRPPPNKKLCKMQEIESAFVWADCNMLCDR